MARPGAKEAVVAPVEVFFGAFVLMFTLVGLVRGFLRELGVTTVMILILFFLHQFDPFLEAGVARVLALGGRLTAGGDHQLIRCWLYLLVIVAAAFISYEGETLGFGGQLPRGPNKAFLGAVAGAINGYLIVGSIWFYMDKFGYPLTWLGFSADKLSKAAQAILPFLPTPFLGQPILLGQSLLLYLSMFLVIARVIR